MNMLFFFFIYQRAIYEAAGFSYSYLFFVVALALSLSQKLYYLISLVARHNMSGDLLLLIFT
jgi:hypothetical protein